VGDGSAELHFDDLRRVSYSKVGEIGGLRPGEEGVVASSFPMFSSYFMGQTGETFIECRC